MGAAAVAVNGGAAWGNLRVQLGTLYRIYTLYIPLIYLIYRVTQGSCFGAGTWGGGVLRAVLLLWGWVCHVGAAPASPSSRSLLQGDLGYCRDTQVGPLQAGCWPASACPTEAPVACQSQLPEQELGCAVGVSGALPDVPGQLPCGGSSRRAGGLAGGMRQAACSWYVST